MSTESMEFTGTRNPTPSSTSIVVLVSLLVNFQRKLDSVVSGEVPGPAKNRQYSWILQIKKQTNLFEFDLENEPAEFLRFFVLETLE